jgi:predicted amidophosphoribosyltransferase
MAPLMASLLDGDRFDAVTPVPLHRSRLAKRGFNQAELMAKSVAGRISAPVLDKLKVVRRTRDQVELSAGARRANVVGAYAPRGARCGQDPPRRRRLHDRRHLERVRHGFEKGGRRRGPRPDPVQDNLACQQGQKADC